MSLSEIYQKGLEVLQSNNKLKETIRGVETEAVLRNNEEIFRRYHFVQKAIDSVEATLDVNLLDVSLMVPILMSSITSPIPQIQEDGLLKVARALKTTGSMMFLGTPVPPNLKELVAVGVPIAQTFKPYANRDKLMKMISAAEDAGVTWIGVEIDAGQGTKTLDNQRAKKCLPISVEELKEIKRRIKIPFVLKGVLSSWDAEKALEVGADIVVVSNHGAHTIDYLPHPLEVMDEITTVIKGRIPIIVDGGFRRGTDVLKGLALGAKAIGLGRPILYGLAAGGEKGVASVITEIANELRRTMTMTGVKNCNEVQKEVIRFVH